MESKISVAIATFNEEKNLSRCLDSVKDWIDEIVIVDGGSTDRTVEIAKRYGARVIITNNPPIFHINKQKAIDACSGDWILQLDADEVVTKELRSEILDTICHPELDSGSQTIKIPKQVRNDVNCLNSKIVAYAIPRKNFFLGRWLKKGGQYPDYVIRFFRRGKAYLPCKSVHEQMEVKGKVDYFKGDLLHFTAPTFSRYLTNADRYTSLLAGEIKDREKKNYLFDFINYMFIKPAYWFCLTFVRHKGFLDGWQGFVFSFCSALRFPVAYIKHLRLI